MSATKTCGDCGRTRTKLARGICSTCYGIRKRVGQPLPPVSSTSVRGRVEDVLEDVAFLAATGAGLREAARRTNTTPVALEKLLIRHGLHDLLSMLNAQDEVPEVYLNGRFDDRSNARTRDPGRGTWKVA